MQYPEFQPSFNYITINHSNIIGVKTDYSVFDYLINSPIFTFYSTNKKIKILPEHLLEFLSNISYGPSIHIVAEIKYNNKTLAMEHISQFPNTENEAKEYIVHNLNYMLKSLKYEMYDLSNFKEKANTIYHKLFDLHHSAYFDYKAIEVKTQLEEELKLLEKTMNEEFERIIMPIEDDSIEILDDGRSSNALEPEDIGLQILESKHQFRLTRKSLKNLSKKKTNKFVLPFDISKVDDVEKFKKLCEKPFGFLLYNGAKFSMALKGTETKQIFKDNFAYEFFYSTKKYLDDREAAHFEKVRTIDLNIKAIDAEIKRLKKDFENKIKAVGNEKFAKFLVGRTTANIKKLRETEKKLKRLYHVESNKQLLNRIKFFERFAELYIGYDVTDDIIQDLSQLGYTSKKHYEEALCCLMAVLKLIESNENKLVAPTIVVDYIKYDNPEILMVIAGHLFINTIILNETQKG